MAGAEPAGLRKSTARVEVTPLIDRQGGDDPIDAAAQRRPGLTVPVGDMIGKLPTGDCEVPARIEVAGSAHGNGIDNTIGSRQHRKTLCPVFVAGVRLRADWCKTWRLAGPADQPVAAGIEADGPPGRQIQGPVGVEVVGQGRRHHDE